MSQAKPQDNVSEQVEVAEVKDIDAAVVILDYPIERSGGVIEKVTVRRPRAGALRDVKLMDLAQMDTQSLITVLPRITSPTLTKAEIKNLSPADLMALGVEVAGFFVPKSVREEFPNA